MSQPTVSRDIDFIRNPTNNARKNKRPCSSLLYELQNGLDGIQELMKNLWLIIDNPKIGVKEKMKATKLVTVLLQYAIWLIRR